MSGFAAFASLEDYIRSYWQATPVVFENEGFPLSDEPSAFVFVEIFGDFLSQESFGTPGDNLWRETGEIRGHILVPNGTGSRQARQLASEFVGLFQEIEVEGVRFRDMSVGAGDPGEGDGNYWRMTTSVSWERDQ